MQLKSTTMAHGQRLLFAIAVLALTIAAARPASAGAIERIKQTGHITLGYATEGRPFIFRNDAGSPDGYGAALCARIADDVKVYLGLSNLTVDWVAVPPEGRVSQVQQGNVDLMCAPAAASIARRQEVSFSIPVFPGGVRAVLRKDAPASLRDALANGAGNRPVWRGSPALTVLQKKTYVVVEGTTSQAWLKDRINEFGIEAKTVTAPDYRAGLREVADGKADVFFGDRTLILGNLDGGSLKNFQILDRLITQEPYALVLARNDDDFRLLVDRALSEFYDGADFAPVYSKWFGGFDQATKTFFSWSSVPK